MSEVTKAVITDESAQKILQEMQVANSINREARDLMSEQVEATRKLHEKMGKASYEAAAVYYVPVTYDGTTYSLEGIAFDDILNAYEDGKELILKITYGNSVYYANMVFFNHLSVTIQNVWSFQFYSITNPEAGKKGYYLINRTEKTSSGTVTEKIEFIQAGFYASEVVCDVTIGGTPYTTLDAALGAIAAALG